MDSDRRRFLGAVVTAGTIAIAGCSGDDGGGDGLVGGEDGDGGGSDGDGGGSDGDGGGSDGGDSDGDGGGSDGGGDVIGASGDEFNHFEFEAGERYVYDVYMKSDGEGTFTWEVTDVSEDRMTVHSKYDVGDTFYESTVTGDENTIRGQMMGTPAGAFMALAVYSPAWGYYNRGDLEVGNRWEVSNPEGSVVFEITDKELYAGVECYASEMHQDGELRHAACVNPKLGFAAYTVFYDEDGNRELEMELVEYSPPG